MSGIVCALRGGLDSRETMTRAISLAREASLPLHFLYVVNRELMSDTTARSARTVEDELRQMGGSVVRVAQAIANSHGLSAQGAVRCGDVEDEITGLCQDVDADYLVLSVPHAHKETSVFTPHRLAQLQDRVESEAGVKVVLTEGDLS